MYLWAYSKVLTRLTYLTLFIRISGSVSLLVGIALPSSIEPIKIILKESIKLTMSILYWNIFKMETQYIVRRQYIIHAGVNCLVQIPFYSH